MQILVVVSPGLTLAHAIYVQTTALSVCGVRGGHVFLSFGRAETTDSSTCL